MSWARPFVTLQAPKANAKVEAVSGIRPKSGMVNLDQAVNGKTERQETWSLSPPTASWNDIWPAQPGEPSLINDAAV